MPDEKESVTLTEEQITHIVDQCYNRFYQQVGKTAVTKAMTWLGVAVVVVLMFLAGTGRLIK